MKRKEGIRYTPGIQWCAAGNGREMEKERENGGDGEGERKGKRGAMQTGEKIKTDVKKKKEEK